MRARRAASVWVGRGSFPPAACQNMLPLGWLGGDGRGGRSPSRTRWPVSAPPSAWTSPIKFGGSGSTGACDVLHGQPPHTGGAAVLNVAFAHPRTLCMKLLRGGGPVKTSPWRGSKHPAGFSPCVPGTVGVPAPVRRATGGCQGLRAGSCTSL